MNSRNIIALFITLSLSYPLCSIADTAPAAMSAEQAKSEGKVLGTLVVLNENEIAAGELANKKSSNADVKEFAAFMIKEHGDNLSKTTELAKKLDITTVEDKVALKLKNKGKMELAILNKLDGAAFDKAYINAMVKGHTDALALVNTLISNTSNPLIKAHLEATKVHVEHHLEKAKAIQASLK